ncbi:MAG: uroporphyrinogen-III synthase [Caulobacterales bacterium]
MAARRPSVWVTRTEPGASATARRVEALGAEAILEPLLEVRALADAPIDLAEVCALAFTSANAVRVFAELCHARDLPVFTVADATAAAARAVGFATVVSARGDVAALAELLIARRRDLGGIVLHPGAAEPAGDLAGALAGAGVPVRDLTLYETAPRDPSPALLARLQNIDLVLLHSPKAARRLVEVLDANPAPHLIAFCLSRAVAEPLSGAGLAKVRVAASPTEDDLLALIGTAD